jgi:hypothetical protein
MFTLFFSLQDTYKLEMIKKHGENFNWENESINDQASYASEDRKAHGQ